METIITRTPKSLAIETPGFVIGKELTKHIRDNFIWSRHLEYSVQGNVLAFEMVSSSLPETEMEAFKKSVTNFVQAHEAASDKITKDQLELVYSNWES